MRSALHSTVIASGEARINSTAVRRLCGHPAIRPNGVDAHSCERTSPAISPPPPKEWAFAGGRSASTKRHIRIARQPKLLPASGRLRFFQEAEPGTDHLAGAAVSADREP